ncbi:UDP-N-acetylenolpyruvoylglucosamine reductase, partial [Gardnerella vaginalis]
MSMQSSLSKSDNPTFADLTTIGVGGSIARFVEPNSRVAVIEAVEDADCAGLPLCVIGGGSNMLVSDESFNGVVVRDARREICVLDEAAPSEDGVDKDSGDCLVHVSAEAGCNWDDFVSHTIQLGLEGVEALSGIPGTVGASVVQNIGAYGAEVAQSVECVEVWDRKDKTTFYMGLKDLKFGYRTSVLKQSMYRAPGVPADCFFPTPRYVVLSVTFCLKHSKTGV